MQTAPPTGTARALLSGAGELWSRIPGHPFVRATADGTLPAAAFDRWLVADAGFVHGFRRFLGGLVTIAPGADAADVLAAAFGPLGTETELFRRAATARGLELGAEPGPTALGYTSFLLASLADGYQTAVAVLYGAEKAYLDAWAPVRATADRTSPYWPFVDNWSSPAFASWVDAVAELVEHAAPGGPTPPMRTAFARVVRFELRFWDAVHAGEAW